MVLPETESSSDEENLDSMTTYHQPKIEPTEIAGSEINQSSSIIPSSNLPGPAKLRAIFRNRIISSSDDSDGNASNTLSKAGDIGIKPRVAVENIVCNEDSRWTLKYAAKGENITELIKGSNVYASKFEVASVVNTAKNQTEMARALLRVIFTEDALKKCSLTGAKPKDKTQTVRPGLDANGVKCLVLYVQEHAKTMNWPLKDKQTITRSLSSKLNEIKDALNLKKS